MSPQKYQIIINLSNNLPEDFSISFDELSSWNLNKYKPVYKSEKDSPSLKLQSFEEVELICDNPQFIAGRFRIPVDDGEGKISKIPFDFMIAKYILERKKNRSAFRTPFFDKLSGVQIRNIHGKVVDGIMPECLKKIRERNEFLRQKKLFSSK